MEKEKICYKKIGDVYTKVDDLYWLLHNNKDVNFFNGDEEHSRSTNNCLIRLINDVRKDLVEILKDLDEFSDDNDE